LAAAGSDADSQQHLRTSQQPPAPPASAVLQARLYPANEIATQTGVLNGTVTNMMSGKGALI